MTERATVLGEHDPRLLDVSSNICQKMLDTGRLLIDEEQIEDDELVDLLTGTGNISHNVALVAEVGVHATREYIEDKRRIPVCSFYLAWHGCPQASGLSLDAANDFIIRYAQELGFIDSSDLRTAKTGLKETTRPKRIRLKHPHLPVEMSLCLSGDLRAEGFRLDYVTG